MKCLHANFQPRTAFGLYMKMPWHMQKVVMKNIPGPYVFIPSSSLCVIAENGVEFELIEERV